MPDAAVKTAAPRKPSARRTTVKKPAVTKEPTTTVEEATEAIPRTRVAESVITLIPHPDGDTKRYSRWVAPEGSLAFGTVYAPVGTSEVTITAV